MTTKRYRVVPGTESEIHEEPHIEGSRITVMDVHARVDQHGRSPPWVAERFNLDVAAVYEALAYYQRNLGEMREVEERHERAVAEARDRSSLTPPDE